MTDLGHSAFGDGDEAINSVSQLGMPPASTGDPPTVHRADMGRHYRGLAMHAAGGVHEYALSIARRTIPPGGKVLDVGCGVGALSARLHDAGFAVTAADLDISDYRAEPAVVRWDVTDQQRPVVDSSFDGVCAIEILEHVENPLRALRNIRAILKPGGTLVVSTPYLGHPRSRIKYLWRGAPSYFGPLEYHGSGHRTLLPDWLLELHLQDAGYVGIEKSYAGQFNLTGPGRRPYAVLKRVLKALNRWPKPSVDDAAVTFFVARKPANPRGMTPARIEARLRL